jgi:NO-binding membrane sensor protein with MHYT domain
MHFIAMLGFTIPGQQILYNVPLTLASMLVAIAVVGIGLFIVGFGDGGWPPLLAGGVTIGAGVAAMHYLGMAAMSMQDSMSYNMPLVALSLLIAVAAGTAALWAAARVATTGATIAAALIMGAAVTGSHYVVMAALTVSPAPMSSMAMASGAGLSTVSGTTAAVFLIPLLLVISIATFAVTLTISMSPDADEIAADAEMERRLEYLRRRQAWRQLPSRPDSAPPGSVLDDRF